MKKIIAHPFITFILFGLSIALSLILDYLNSPQTYIFNYYYLFKVVLIHLSVAGFQTLFFTFVAPVQRFSVFLSLISLYLLLFKLGELITAELGFQLSLDFSLILNIVLFVIYLSGWLFFIERKDYSKALLILLPIMILNVYHHLAAHNYFSERSGTYPIYQSDLRQNIWLENKIKSVDEIFN